MTTVRLDPRFVPGKLFSDVPEPPFPKVFLAPVPRVNRHGAFFSSRFPE